jgi:hypothetical protein
MTSGCPLLAQSTNTVNRREVIRSFKDAQHLVWKAPVVFLQHQHMTTIGEENVAFVMPSSLVMSKENSGFCSYFG